MCAVSVWDTWIGISDTKLDDMSGDVVAWKRLSALPHKLQSGIDWQVVWVNNFLFFQDISGASYLFDPRSLHWEKLTDGEGLQTSFSLFSDKSDVFVIGAKDARTISRFSFTEKKWKPCAQMRNRSFLLTCCKSGGNIFIVGAYSAGRSDRPRRKGVGMSFHKFNTETSHLTALKDITILGHYHITWLHSVHDVIYLVQGNREYCYNELADCWESNEGNIQLPQEYNGYWRPCGRIGNIYSIMESTPSSEEDVVELTEDGYITRFSYDIYDTGFELLNGYFDLIVTPARPKGLSRYIQS
jgi:hypothetical protein